MIYFGGNNGNSVDKLFIIRMVDLIMAKRNLVVIIFFTMDFIPILFFEIIDCPKFEKNCLFDKRRQFLLADWKKHFAAG